MADKKEVNIMLLGIVAILAIVGLVLMFSSPAVTGKQMYNPPPVGPQTQMAYGGDMIGTNIPLCPGGIQRTLEQHNIVYTGMSNMMCGWYTCPGTDIAPVMGCMPV